MNQAINPIHASTKNISHYPTELRVQNIQQARANNSDRLHDIASNTRLSISPKPKDIPPLVREKTAKEIVER